MPALYERKKVSLNADDALADIVPDDYAGRLVCSSQDGFTVEGKESAPDGWTRHLVFTTDEIRACIARAASAVVSGDVRPVDLERLNYNGHRREVDVTIYRACESLDELTTDELRERLRRRGMKVSGTKAALVERLQQAAA